MPSQSVELEQTPDKPAVARVLPLDGLRGFLSLGVFVHHAAIYRQYLRDGTWGVTTPFFTQLGPFGVTLFFMITAYLFYGRLIDERGKPNWRRLYLGRLFRIGPIYLVAIAAMFAIVAWRSSGLLVRPLDLAGQVLAWLALGAGPRVDLNGYWDTRHLLAGVTWTLQSEWLFYGLLPLLALAARGRAFLVMPLVGFFFTLGVLAVAPSDAIPACVTPFFAGMLCAALQRTRHALKPPAWLASCVVIGLIGSLFIFNLDARGCIASGALAAAFLLIVSGGSVFGLLTCYTARGLGAISYDIYMLHGLVLAELCAIPTVRTAVLASEQGHLAMATAATVILLPLAISLHVLIERPGIAWAKGSQGEIS